MYNTLSDFYRSKEWADFRKVIIAERTRADGFVYDEITGKPIVKAYDIILHHKTELTLENVNDCNVTLNPDNIMVVSFKTHNEIHNRFGKWTRHIYLVYGCPLSGKSTYVKERAGIHDLIIDVDKIYACVSNNPLYIKSGRLYDCMDAVKQALFDCIKYKRGKWVNAFIVGGYAFKGERERIASEYGAEEVFIDCDKETALQRLASAQDGRDIKEWTKYIEDWFTRYAA
ncbi:MAG: HNH endonuclease [Candidatus Coproplasma sp.]